MVVGRCASELSGQVPRVREWERLPGRPRPEPGRGQGKAFAEGLFLLVAVESCQNLLAVLG